MELSRRFSRASSTSERWKDEETSSPTFGVASLLAACRYHEPRGARSSNVERIEEIAGAFGVFAKDIGERVDTQLRVGLLEKVVLELRDSVAELLNRRIIYVPITSLEPEPFELNRQICIVVEPDEDQFIATFFDANINASGDTEVEAVDNVKDAIITSFRRFQELGPERLGPGPGKQFAVLRSLIVPKK
jgi:hypothetical protein